MLLGPLEVDLMRPVFAVADDKAFETHHLQHVEKRTRHFKVLLAEEGCAANV